ncbi:MAG TPA: DNA-protecting protein DprA, partial [Candidatus Parcubacteria bacterium]|nr:DNA-protecting protein DprA [Candidatus Parcubacteria bacterium]
DLSEAGLTIVSGLAPGIDTFAHRAAIEQGKRTIAVLGTGIDEKSVYPKENIGLSREIIERGGAVLSEYPPGTRGTRFTFPRRNRIISGLSLGVLVIEAKEKSGSLITANYALKQNRKIFAVPGSIYSKNSSGPHFLIKNGAVLVENSNDILKEINLKPPVSDPKKDIKKSGGKTENETEKIVLSTLEGEALYIDKIIEKTKIPAAKIAGVLAILEIKGKVKNLGGNVYALKR